MTSPDPGARPSTPQPSRRRVLTAAWTAPAVLSASAAPAAAASPGPRPEWGLFAQVIDTQRSSPYDTLYGVMSFAGGVSETSGTHAAAAGTAASGAGSFTPGGSLSQGVYGGAGLWISAPRAADRTFLEGATTMPAGTQLRLEITAAFAPGDEGYEPILWGSGPAAQKAKILTGSTSEREGLNGAALNPTFESQQVDGSLWRGSVLFTTAEDLVASGPSTPYAQILVSQLPVYWTEHGPVSISARLTVMATQLTAMTATGDSTVLPVLETSVTATL